MGVMDGRCDLGVGGPAAEAAGNWCKARPSPGWSSGVSWGAPAGQGRLPGNWLGALRALALAAVVLGTVFAVPARAAVPGAVAVEGALATAGGGPVSDGQYAMTFSLYAAEQGGTAVWSEAATVTVQAGRFSQVLGLSKPLAPALAAGGAWLAGQVGAEPELPRKALAAVPFALRAGVAEAIDCSGCIPATAIKPGSLDASVLAFNYAGSDSKGGAATSAVLAKDLQCTGCVSVAELKFDADVDVGAHSVTASEFVGSGAKLTGLAKVAGSGAYADLSGAPAAIQGACQVGQVVTGIGADGKLVCGVAPMQLPPDGLAAVSNGALSNVSTASFPGLAGATLPIKDYYPKGVADTVTVPDLGTLQAISVSMALSNSDVAGLSVFLTDPDGVEFTLYDKGLKGPGLDTKFPVPTALVKGDLTIWKGKNPKGPWTLKVVDSVFNDVPTDGLVSKWALDLQILSGKKVSATGELDVSGQASVGGDLVVKGNLILSGSSSHVVQVCKFGSDECLGQYMYSSGTGITDLQFGYRTPGKFGGFSTAKVFNVSCDTGAGPSVEGSPTGTSSYTEFNCSGVEWRTSGGGPLFRPAPTYVCLKSGYYPGKVCSYKTASGCVNVNVNGTGQCQGIGGWVVGVFGSGDGAQTVELR